MKINENKLNLWMQEYQKNLIQSVKDYPFEYGFGSDQIPKVAEKMRTAFSNQSYNKDGRAVKLTCKTFNIPHTYTAINSFLQSE